VPLNAEEKVKEEIRFNTEILKVLSLFFITTAGGVSSLIIGGLNNGAKVVITAFGMIFVVVIGILGLVIYTNTKKINGMNEIFGYIAIAAMFLSGIVPMVIGIFHYIKENRKLDEVKRSKKLETSQQKPKQEKYAIQ
jgi:hypothetical protein